MDPRDENKYLLQAKRGERDVCADDLQQTIVTALLMVGDLLAGLLDVGRGRYEWLKLLEGVLERCRILNCEEDEVLHALGESQPS